MGLVYIKGLVKAGDKKVKVNFLVDSGPTYTVLRRDVWKRLSLSPKRGVELVLADGTAISRKLSEATVELPGHVEYHSPIVLGEQEDENLLGTVTLEIFGLILDPLKRELRPMRLSLR